MNEPPRDPDATQRVARPEPSSAPAPEPAAAPGPAPATRTVAIPTPERTAAMPAEPAAETTAAIPAQPAPERTVAMPAPEWTAALPAPAPTFTPPPELPAPPLEPPAPTLELPAPLPELPGSTPERPQDSVPRLSPATPPPPPEGDEPALGEGRAQTARLSPLPFLAVLAAGVAAVLGLFALLGDRGRGEVQEAAAAPAPVPSSAAPALAEERVLLVFQDRQGELAVTSEGRVHGLDGVDPVVQRRLARALAAGELALPDDLASLGAGAASSAPASTFVPLAPLGTRVLDERPLFRWRPAAEPAAYVVTVVDASGQPLVVSPALRDEQWRPPRALPRRRTLAWWVETRPRGRGAEPERSAPARFSVLGVEDLAWVERELVAGGGSRLVAAVLYAEVGALDEARGAAAELGAANPASPEIQRLRARLAAAGGS